MLSSGSGTHQKHPQLPKLLLVLWEPHAPAQFPQEHFGNAGNWYLPVSWSPFSSLGSSLPVVHTGQGLFPLKGLSPSPNLCFSLTQPWCELAVWAITHPDFIGHALFSKAVCRDLSKRSWEVISWQISAQMSPHVVPVGSPFIHQPVQVLVKATLLPFELGAFQVLSCISFLLWLLHFYSFCLERLMAFCNCMSFFPSMRTSFP